MRKRCSNTQPAHGGNIDDKPPIQLPVPCHPSAPVPPAASLDRLLTRAARQSGCLLPPQRRPERGVQRDRDRQGAGD